MERTQIINLLIDKISAKRYLEIGVCEGKNISKVNCEYKLGVDPNLESKSDIKLTSDEFFEQNKETFDVIFVDGLHHADQVYRDIINSLKVLNEGGYIVCHDINPTCEDHQIIPYRGGVWNGDCWKAFVDLRRNRDDLEMYTVDTDCGCGIIQKGKQDLLDGSDELTWENLEKNRNNWLNLISIESFLKKINHNPNNTNSLLNDLLTKYIFDSENAENNFNLAYYYDSIGQTASALSFYLRTAERTDNDLLKYESLIRGSICFEKQGTRSFTVKTMLQHAVALLPTRPEAYYLLSKFYSKEHKDGSWFDSYLIASIGEKVCDSEPTKFITEIDCPIYGILLQKALSSWWCGLCEESKDLFLNLYNNYEMTDEHKKICIENLKKMNVNIENPKNFESNIVLELDSKLPEYNNTSKSGIISFVP